MPKRKKSCHTSTEFLVKLLISKKSRKKKVDRKSYKFLADRTCTSAWTVLSVRFAWANCPTFAPLCQVHERQLSFFSFIASYPDREMHPSSEYEEQVVGAGPLCPGPSALCAPPTTSQSCPGPEPNPQSLTDFLSQWTANIQPKFIPLLSSLSRTDAAKSILLCQVCLVCSSPQERKAFFEMTCKGYCLSYDMYK